MSSAKQVWELSRAILADRDGYIAVLNVYMDESGTHDDSPVVTVAAYIGRPRQWRDWTKEWNAAKKPIKVFHASKAANLVGEFNGWTEAERDDLVKRILPVIPKHKFAGVVVGIRMKAFEEAMKPHPELREMFGTPYTACFHWTVKKIMNLMEETHNNERIAFFHEVNDYQGEASSAFEFIKRQRKTHISIMSLTFGGKNDFVPLQAADILAYEGNKKLRNPSGSERRAFQVLSPANGRMHVSFYGENTMPKLIEFLSGLRESFKHAPSERPV